MKFLRNIALAMLLVLPAVPALAHHDGEIASVGDMRISHAWTKETGGTAHAIEVFLTLENVGDEEERLIGGTTRFSEPAMFQAPVLASDGAVAVQDVSAIVIDAGQSVTLQPGGIRIVLNDVKRTLRAGGHFHMHLEFANAGTVEIDVEIEDENYQPKRPAS